MIAPANGAWASPVILVRKKDGAWRFCVDYQKLNEVTDADAFSLPHIDDSINALSRNKYFTMLVLASSY